MDALDAEIGAWLVSRSGDPVFRRFSSHLRTLEIALTRMCSRLRAEIEAVSGDTAEGYAHCRRVDRGLTTLRRLFLWYAEKYDQRAAGGHQAVLAAADELARSCWSAGFAAVGRKPPTGPLCFVDNRTDAVARRRCDLPTELRPPSDDPLMEFVDRLPIPVIALPEQAVREGWWVVLAAHETGHHVLHDLDLGVPVRQALREAVPRDLAANWVAWHNEVFADVFSLLMVGPAAAWAIDELQYGPREGMSLASGGYPPPLVRLALLGETLKALGAPAGIPCAADAAAVEDAKTAPQLAVVPDVVAALLDLPLGDTKLRCLALDEVIRTGPSVRAWSAQLTRPEPAIGAIETRRAPRLLIAAAVHRYRALAPAAGDAVTGRLHTALLSLLGRSGVPGLLAPSPETDVETLADALGELLIERAAEGEPA
ncbi:hypothetical protein [Amycolatopsis orientalis]|uniref:hypothetical protein n=1 Tax=Amycolatopsis orientalis TaxID=31958 RepID=UPI00055B3595|nr:hypothetical protein [Amycolatopsis orientalis]